MPRLSLDELAGSLPNGFHDAELKALAIDFVKREMRLSLDVWIGDLNVPPGDEREAYRLAEVSLTGLVYCVCEPPDAQLPYSRPHGVKIDVGAMQELKAPPEMKLPSIGEDAFANWIYSSDWNAFIYVAAQDAQLTWLE
jgi:hypothetical protein